MEVTVQYDFLAKTPSVKAAQVQDAFGIQFDQGSYVIADRIQLPLEPKQVVLFSGESGSGKSSLMRAAANQLQGVVNLSDIQFTDDILIDQLGLSFEASMSLLSTCGLSEARLMLRTPLELSDGQRYRFALAMAMAQQPDWIVADEFAAMLDRTLAKVLAVNLRKYADRTSTGFLLATTHEDLLEDLAPDVHIACRQGEPPVITRAADTVTTTSTLKKNGTSASSRISGSVPRPKPTGRISHGGITAATTSDSPAS
jgi:hypothetical protein